MNNPVEMFKFIARHILFPVPAHLSENFIQINDEKMCFLEKSLKKNYHTGWRAESSYSPEEYRADVHAHLHERIESDRKIVIPWIDNASSLRGKRILEIGCGTGSSSVALAEQGADVIGIDVDEMALLVAEKRAELYEVNLKLIKMNAEGIRGSFAQERLDMIIFFACLEHMTIHERLSSLQDAWHLLPAGGLLIIVETPNRLWYFDSHTSRLPFFHWLPNELAFAYSKFSSRRNFREVYTKYDKDQREHFLRRGRGVSFHEIDMSIGDVAKLQIVSSLSSFEGFRYKLKKTRTERKYKKMLMDISPNIHNGFHDDYLYLIIKKSK